MGVGVPSGMTAAAVVQRLESRENFPPFLREKRRASFLLDCFARDIAMSLATIQPLTMSRFIHFIMAALALLVFSLTGCHAISESPSFAPSLSEAPTFSPSLVPSPNPTGTPAPTTLAPTFPPVEMEKFEWDLDRVGNARLAFTEEYDMGEIMLDYNISLRDVAVQLYESDCNTAVSSVVATADAVVTQASLRHANLTVSIDVVQENVTSSPIWSDVSVGEGLIAMCVRVDLLLDDVNGTSVHFHEQKLRVTIRLLQGFEVGTVDLSRVSPDEEDGDAAVDYDIVACQCNPSFECLTPVLTQGSAAYLCVSSLDDDVEIIDIQALSFSQGSYSVNSIVGGQEDLFTTVTIVDKKALIRNQMLSVFFEQYNPEDVIANGFALLGFTEEVGRRRLLRTSIKPHRGLDTVLKEDDVSFRISMPVESSLNVNSGAVDEICSLMSVATIMLGIAVLLA